MKTQSGEGRASTAFSASSSTGTMLSQPNLSIFSRISDIASSDLSTAYTRPSVHCTAISTETEPVPAPMSQHMLSRSAPSFEMHTARTSDLVIGTLPLMNSPSGMPIRRCFSGLSLTVSRTDSSDTDTFFSSSAVPFITRSSSYPSLSPMQTLMSPRPNSPSLRQTSAASVSPPSRKKVFS